MSVRCNMVVIEDIERHPEGVNATFVAMPRVGEHVMGWGQVESISHIAMVDGEPGLPYPAVTVFVYRNGRPKDR